MADLAEPSSRTTKIASSALIVMAGYLASRVLGLVREMVIGARFGTSGEYDAYVAAFRIPDLLFLLLMGGALASSFIPVFTSYLARNDTRRAWRLATYTINGSMVVLVVASVITALLASQLVPWLIAPGMSPSQQALAIELTRILLLSPLFLGLGGIAMGILNSHQSFLLPAIAPVAYNLCIIFGAVALAPFFGVQGLAMGVVLGAAGNFLIQVPGLRRLRFKYTSALNTRDKGLRKVFTLLLPRLLGQAAFQINFIVITNIASRLVVGSVSALNYAYLLMLLPHGVFALSLSAVVFPQMALQYGGRQVDEMRDTLAKGLKALLFLTLPSAAGLMILREPVVRLLLQFGSFTGHSTEMVAWALLFFSAGIPAFAVVEIVTRAFYALHDTKTPVFASVATIAVNIVLSLVLVNSLAHGGLALSVSITTTFEMIILLVIFRRRVGGMSKRGVVVSALKSTVAAAVMGAVLLALLRLFGPSIPQVRSVSQAIWTVLLLGLGLASYLGAAYVLRSDELQIVGSVMRKLGFRSLRKPSR